MNPKKKMKERNHQFFIQLSYMLHTIAVFCKMILIKFILFCIKKKKKSKQPDDAKDFTHSYIDRHDGIV